MIHKATGTKIETVTGGSSDDTFVFDDGWGNYTISSGGTLDEDVLDFSAVSANLIFIIHMDGTVSVSDGTLVVTDADGHKTVTGGSNSLGPSAGIDIIRGGSGTNTLHVRGPGGIRRLHRRRRHQHPRLLGVHDRHHLDLTTMDVVYSGTVDGGTVTSLGVGYATGVKGVNNISPRDRRHLLGDVLTGPDTDNIWNITGANSGNINAEITFSESRT